LFLMGVEVKSVVAIYVIIALILFGSLYLFVYFPGGIDQTTPIAVTLYSYLFTSVSWLLTITLFLLLVSCLFNPPLHERIWQVFPYASLIPIALGMFYLLIAYGLYKKKGWAWTFALASALLTIPSDFFMMLQLWFVPMAVIALILNIFIVHQLIQQEIRELYGNPFKKLKDALFRGDRLLRSCA
jgi:hypothetical protein